MTTSDIINAILCILSFFLAAISVITVAITIRQNNKMIESSTRPYVVVTSQTTNFQRTSFYLVLKNYGQSGANIDSLTCNIDLSKCSHDAHFVPLGHLDNTFIAPQQSIVCTLDTNKMLSEQIERLQFEIKYSNGTRSYTEKCNVNFLAYQQNTQSRASTPAAEMKIISYTLQDLVEKHF